MAYGIGYVGGYGGGFNNQNRNNLALIQVNEDDDWNSSYKYMNYPKGKRGVTLDLLNNNNLEYIPRTFTITTQNDSYKFNIDFLKESSLAIKEALSKTPEMLQFHIDVNDDQNVMKKFEDIFQFKKAVFYISDLNVIHKIVESLKVVDCPPFMLPEEQQLVNCSVPTKSYIQFDKNNLSNFLKTLNNTFKVTVNGTEYNCNSIGVNSSQVIRKYREENPETTNFNLTYEIDDDDDSNFLLIKDLFDFQIVKITIDNMNYLAKMAEILEIDSIKFNIDRYINSYENAKQLIDDKTTMIDTINQIFEWLFNIKELTIEVVTKNIKESVWVNSESDVKELVACLLEVIRADYYMQNSIIELILALNESINENENLKVLLPFIIKKIVSDLTINKSYCSFAYKLYKKDLLKLQEILDKISSNNIYESIFILEWFYPEYIEEKKTNLDKLFMNDKSSAVYKFLSKYSIEKYKLMRDFDEPDDSITNAILHDDVDKFQQIITNGKIDINVDRIPLNLFDNISTHNNFDNRGLGKTYLDYSAECGSIKCFKYLLLNHANINKDTLVYAIYGGNTEIIRTIEQNSMNDFQLDKNNYLQMGGFSAVCNPCIPAIIKHQHNMLDWILEEKNCINVNDLNLTNNNDLINVLSCSVSNGNAHAFIALIDKGLNVDSLMCNPVLDLIISSAARNGFYRLIQLIFSFKPVKKKKKNEYMGGNQHQLLFESSVISGNISIVKLVLNYYKKSYDCSSSIVNALQDAIKLDYKDIVHYIVENIYILRNNSNVRNIFISAIRSKRTDTFNYLVDKLNLQELINTCIINTSDLIKFIGVACRSKCVEIVKNLTDIILLNEPKTNFTYPFISAASANSDEICQYFLDRKVILHINTIAKNSNIVSVKDGKIALYLINISKPEMKKTLSQYFLKDAIKLGNINLVETLLKTSIPNHSTLVEAVNSHNLDIVKLILKINNKASFINELTSNGTVLNIAVLNGDLHIVDYLLSIPGINPNLYDRKNSTPLINAISKSEINIIKSLLNFYGDTIQSQIWQVREGFKQIVKIFSNDKITKNSSQNNFIKDKKDSLFPVISLLMKIDNFDSCYHSHKNELLLYSCKANEIEMFQSLIKSQGVDLNYYLPSNGNTLLMTSIENNNIEIAQMLIDDPRTNINQRNFSKKTALIIAVNNGLEKVVSYLINSPKFDPEESCLNHAFFVSSGRIAQLLYSIPSLNVNYELETTPTNNTNKNNNNNNNVNIHGFHQQHQNKNTDKSDTLYIYETTLIHAVNTKRKDMIDLIIMHPSFDIKESQLEAAIFVAVRSNQIDIAEKLLKLINNDVNITSIIYMYLLKYSIAKKNEDFVLKILSNENFDPIKSNLMSSFLKAINPIIKCNEITLRNNFGAAVNNQNNLIKSLTNIMEDLVQYDQNHSHLIDFSKLLPNGKSFYTFIPSYIENISEVVQFFLDHGVDPNAPDKFSIYPLEFAISINSRAFVSTLLDSNRIDFSIRVNRNNIKNESFLHLAARNDTLPDFINANKIDVNQVDDLGETPLMKACYEMKQNNIYLLFNVGYLDYKLKNKNGEDALEIIKKASENKANSGNFSYKNFGAFGRTQDNRHHNSFPGKFPEEKNEYYSKLISYIKNF